MIFNLDVSVFDIRLLLKYQTIYIWSRDFKLFNLIIPKYEYYHSLYIIFTKVIVRLYLDQYWYKRLYNYMYYNDNVHKNWSFHYNDTIKGSLIDQQLPLYWEDTKS